MSTEYIDNFNAYKNEWDQTINNIGYRESHFEFKT